METDAKDKDETLKKLYSLRRFGIKPGLERVSKALKFGSDPRKKLKFVHVAGTNGKGTVGTLLAAALKLSGHKTGLYSSPHLSRFNERIQIDGEPIPDDDLIELARKYSRLAEKDFFTFFELTTAMAFEYFADKNVDIAVVEAGMGGASDATNAITPEISIIVSVDLDHKEYLGETIAEIAKEKAGVIKENRPIVVGKLSGEALAVAKEFAAKKKSPFIEALSFYSIENYRPLPELKSSFDLKGEKRDFGNIILNAPGKKNAENFAVAVAAAERLKGFEISDAALKKAAESFPKEFFFKARIQLLRADPPLILDSAHNPAAINNLVQTLDEYYPQTKWNAVFAMMKDKDAKAALRILKKATKKITLLRLNNDRARSVEELKTLALKEGLKAVEIFLSPQKLAEVIIDAKEPTFITGSFFLSGELLPYLNNFKTP